MKLHYLFLILLLSSVSCTTDITETSKKYDEIENELYIQEKYEEALTNIDHALELEADNGSYIRHKGLIYYKQNKLGDSAQQFIKALKINNKDAMARFLLASIAGLKGQNDLAEKQANKALEDNNGKNKELESSLLKLISTLKTKSNN